jgi:exodeoxyribonuclease-5
LSAQRRGGPAASNLNPDQLTPDQQAVATAFAAWLAAPADGTPFVLSGYAGSGKTFLSMHLLAQVEAKGLCWTVVAPTPKAVGVLRRQLQLAQLKPSWYPSTIHRLLRLKLKRLRDLERCEPTEQTALALEHLGLVLVDEASMVDSALLEIALRCAHPYRTRLVFVGDPAQLPPVGEASSPVFALARAERLMLSQVVRHQGPVLRLASGLREGNLPCRPAPIFAPISTAQGMVCALERRAWLIAAQEALRRSAATDNPDLARILCYTNRCLEQLVPLARRALHGAMADQLPVLPGELLITRSAVMAPACRAGEEGGDPGGEEADMVLGSNRELVVRDVTPERCDLAEFGISASGLAGLGAPVIDTLSATVETGAGQLCLRLLPPLGSAGRGALDAVLERLRQQARLAGKQEARGLWRSFFLLRDSFAWLGPAAVRTVHRSQGSTCGEVFVDADVFWPKDPLLRRQLVYVAVSRASQSVSLVGGAAGGGDREVWEQWLQDRQGAGPGGLAASSEPL